MNVWKISASISATIIDIRTKFSKEHKWHTINKPEWPNSHNLKIQDGGCRYLEFRKNVNNSGLNKDICTKFYGKMHHAMRRRPRDQSRNRKLIRVTSSNKCQKHKCVDLGDYNIMFEPNLAQSTNTTLSTRRNNQIHIT